ncbi:MBOAT family O-acyltransferase [Pseudobutyrivibrio sp.]|uniref:MBOAT family O-acyltransferase n=1 Tax=Pseudobutyrivibrio sp. TaxID=2014367 RepID=UPI0025D71C3C|nr:MBOAT family O-acyltransferase [Pseudobutyrivibrio sp.]MBR5648327.1 MBOAT family protein [Pseudobutyrivibrio sp.]
MATIIISYGFSMLLQNTKSKILLWAAIIISASPLIVNRIVGFCGKMEYYSVFEHLIVPLGLSFYTMQMIAYLVDIYTDKIEPQKNILKYALFISFFPQIIQGPIPRYEQLGNQLFEGHSFDDRKLMRGIQLIIWGFFLKFMIADKAGIVVDTVFDGFEGYRGLFVLIAGVLYSLQLYTDFLACVTLSQGMAMLFGIELIDNFNHPYFADSIKDFWRRWHISLSSWLRDYIYIPLGGNRKGALRKNINLLATFVVSGIWHGGGFKYLFWGMMHGIYQVVESLVPYFSRKFTGPAKAFRVLINFFLVMIAWIIFRADTLRIGLRMIYRMVSKFNPWILFDGSLYNLGLHEKEWKVLFVSLLVLLYVSRKQEKGVVLRDVFETYNMAFRWVIYIGAIVTIWVFGTYGLGYNANDFIYGGF